MAVTPADGTGRGTPPAPRPHERWFAPGGPHEALPGRLQPLAAEVLALLLGWQLDHAVHGSLAEVGVGAGRTFIGLAHASRPGETVLGIDPFPDHGERAFLRALDAHLPDRHPGVVGARNDSRRIAAREWIGLLRAPARFVHLCGEPSRDAVLNDLHLAATYLDPRAAIVVDGFLHERHPELTEAIGDGLRASRALLPVAVVPRSGAAPERGCKLVCATRDGAPTYRRLLAERYAAHAPAIRRFAGREVLTFDDA